MKRRSFIKYMPAAALMISRPSLAFSSEAGLGQKRLTILYTNDWHSRIEPFPMDGSRNQGLGGAAKRAALISSIREECDNVLLLDAGDIFQGTPFFNYYLGELEFKLMSAMGYDAVTIGNHDFDGGIDNLAHQMQHAEFDFLVSNYDLSRSPLKEHVQPYRIYNRNGLKIGIFGIGIELKGLVPETLFGETKYLDPVTESKRVSEYLVKGAGCDLVICISHLGYAYRNGKVSDRVIASQSEYIDVIIGGHTHTFLDQPEKIPNAQDREVLVCQAGWAGILLGRLDFSFSMMNGFRSCVYSSRRI